MPAAAVIPAPIVYIKVAAVKKLVVGFRSCLQYVFGVRWAKVLFGLFGFKYLCCWLLPSSKSTMIFHGVYWMLASYFLVTWGNS